MKRLFPLLGLLLAACATGGGRPAGSNLPEVIRTDFTLAGTVRIKGTVKVLSGATLTIAPGARLLFEPYDPDKDGVNDSTLVVEGGLVARGEPDAPIVFTSAAAKPQPGDWLEVRVDRAEGVILQYCVVEYARNGFHTHFSSGVIADCIFRKNIDASHFGQGRFNIWQNLFEGNAGSGVSFRDSVLSIERNIFNGNRNGVFIFEKDRGSWIVLNRFSGSSFADIRLGDFFQGCRPEIEKNRGEEKGGRLINPDGKSEVLPLDTPSSLGQIPNGPTIRSLVLTPLWEKSFGVFLDAPPALALHRTTPSAIVATWGGDLVRLSLQEGKELWRIRVGEVMDSAACVLEELVVVNAWDGKTRAFELASGKPVWSWDWPDSPQDDHRQAAPAHTPPPLDPPPPRMDENGVLFFDLNEHLNVIVGTWGGDYVVLDGKDGKEIRREKLDGAIRGILDSWGEQVGTDAGTLYSLSCDTGECRMTSLLNLGSPIRTTPLKIGNAVIVSTWEGRLYRIEPYSRRVSWEKKLPGSGTFASPAFWYSRLGSLIVVGDGAGFLSEFGEGGQLAVRTNLGSAIHALGAMRENGLLLAGTEEGKLFLLSLPEGRVLGSVATGGAIHGVPAYDRQTRTLVFGSRDGILRANKVEVKETPWQGPE